MENNYLMVNYKKMVNGKCKNAEFVVLNFELMIKYFNLAFQHLTLTICSLNPKHLALTIFLPFSIFLNAQTKITLESAIEIALKK